MFLVGVAGGPPHHYWYRFLDRILPAKTRETVLKKILADQLVAAPAFAFIFFYGMGILQGKAMDSCWTPRPTTW